MSQALLYAFVAGVALPLGAAYGMWLRPSKTQTSLLLAFASGALITAVAYELFGSAFEKHAPAASVSFICGAVVFVLADTWLEKRTKLSAASGAALGFALLAGEILDGVPENLALGVTLVEKSGFVILVAIFIANFPEAIVGSQRMSDAGMSKQKVMAIWSVSGTVLAIPVIVGYSALEGMPEIGLAVPLGFAAGAIMASLADTLMPEAFSEGGPKVALATALGFLTTFLASTFS